MSRTDQLLAAAERDLDCAVAALEAALRPHVICPRSRHPEAPCICGAAEVNAPIEAVLADIRQRAVARRRNA